MKILLNSFSYRKNSSQSNIVNSMHKLDLHLELATVTRGVTLSTLCTTIAIVENNFH